MCMCTVSITGDHLVSILAPSHSYQSLSSAVDSQKLQSHGIDRVLDRYHTVPYRTVPYSNNHEQLIMAPPSTASTYIRLSSQLRSSQRTFIKTLTAVQWQWSAATSTSTSAATT